MARKQLVTIDEAVPCSVQPSKACTDCPFARKSLSGWLGGSTVDEWLAAAHTDSPISCHTMIGPQCAGAAIYRANICKRPRDKSLLVLPKDPETVFATPIEFKEHHMKTPAKPAKKTARVAPPAKLTREQLADLFARAMNLAASLRSQLELEHEGCSVADDNEYHSLAQTIPDGPRHEFYKHGQLSGTELL